ncbi:MULTISPECIES: acetate uptake transporter family protein [Actinomadura]|uniref:acetate uptake transporter family protein n=1 Tax=Actinomadura TaxID=1988 RepID=UPI00344277E5
MARRREHAQSPMSGERAAPSTPAQGAATPAPGAATAVPGRGANEPGEHALWEDRTRVMLQPIAAPSILGLFGLAGATMMVGAWQAGWYGTAATPLILWPFVLLFGGLAQFLAGMWAYRARDGLATAVHGLWGSFWFAWGLLFLLVSAGAVPIALAPVLGVASQGFAFWFIALAVITGLTALAALGENIVMALLLACLAVGSGFTAAGFWAPSGWSLDVGGWLFVATAVISLYAAGALMMENTFGRTILPTGKYRAGGNIPGGRGVRPLEYRYGEPGVKIGQ